MGCAAKISRLRLKKLPTPNLKFVWSFLLLFFDLFNLFNEPFLWSNAISDEKHLQHFQAQA
jgi:hypothetical protein